MLQNVFKVDTIVYVSINLNYDYSISYMEKYSPELHERSIQAILSNKKSERTSIKSF